MHEAASKTAARSGLSKPRARAFEDLVVASVELLNSGKPSTITLEIVPHEDRLSATLVGQGCGALAKKLGTKLDKLAQTKARAFDRSKSRSVATISFDA